MRFSKAENSRRNIASPKPMKISKELMNRQSFIKKVMKGVLSPGRMGYQANRFQSPQGMNVTFINLPSFNSDRGRRKISKMGGLVRSFFSSNSSQGSTTKVNSKVTANVKTNRQKIKNSRRFSKDLLIL